MNIYEGRGWRSVWFQTVTKRGSIVLFYLVNLYILHAIVCPSVA